MMLDTRTFKSPRCVKYIVFVIFFIFVIFLLMNTGVPKHIWSNYSSSSPVPIHFIRSLRGNLSSCFLNPEQSPVDLNADGFFPRSEVDRPTVLSKANSTYFYLNYVFNKILTSLNIKATIIEPSILHCLLNPKEKELLQRRNVSIADFNEFRTTYGILKSDAAKLQNEDNVLKFRRFGYEPLIIQAPLADWMRENENYTGSKIYTSHILFMYYEWNIHVVVFQERSNYLWHAALETRDSFKVPGKKDLLYANDDSAYEMFSFVPLESKYPNLVNIHIPSNSQHFLFQISSSRFLECNLTRAAHLKNSSADPATYSSSSVKKFNVQTLASLHELKLIFHSLLMNFWIFSGTMLGWYRQCDIIPYTSDSDFAAWASEIDDLDFIINYFRANKNLTIRERMGVLDEALEFQLRYAKLRVDVFFMYKIENGSWASGHRPSKGYYFRYYYPPFSLCSADLLGEKVNVPCETEAVIATEYGPNWMTPVSSWYYESSIKNRGPNIYWNEKKRKKAFQEY